MGPPLSVIVCTHNPRRNYLERVLAALRAQTLPLDQWQFIVVDNASQEPVAERFNIGWHPRGRLVREDQLGLTPARLRGIAESSADVLVFVDDDNELAPNYLEEALRISTAYPFLGVWGGSAIPEFEVAPPAWAIPYLPHLGLREVKRDCWANLRTYNESVPIGAGMCVRRPIAERFSEEVARERRILLLGRKGTDLSSHEETFLMLRGCEMGYCTGSFISLRLKHLIPAARLSRDYLLRLMEGNDYSWVLLSFFRGEAVPDEPRASFPRRALNWYRSLQATPFEREMTTVRKRGRVEGIRAVRRLEQDGSLVEELPAR